MVTADGDEFVQNLFLCSARSCLVTSPQRLGQLNSCRMGELGVHRSLLIEDSNGDISREATKLIGRISPEAMRQLSPVIRGKRQSPCAVPPKPFQSGWT